MWSINHNPRHVSTWPLTFQLCSLLPCGNKKSLKAKMKMMCVCLRVCVYIYTTSLNPPPPIGPLCPLSKSHCPIPCLGSMTSLPDVRAQHVIGRGRGGCCGSAHGLAISHHAVGAVEVHTGHMLCHLKTHTNANTHKEKEHTHEWHSCYRYYWLCIGHKGGCLEVQTK